LPIIDRLLSRRRIGSEGCWLWLGAKVRGYGVVSVSGRTQYVHRIAYELFVTSVAEGLTLDHLCHQPACFNPAHLEQVSRAENARRMPREGRRRRTCFNGHVRDDVGINPDGSCAACWPTRARKRPPRRSRDEIDARCAQGHVYEEVGRYPSGGCVECQLIKDKARRKGARPPARYCVRGHDVPIVGRSSSNGECRECAREYARKRYGYKRTAADIRAQCRNGHERTAENTALVKRTRDGKEVIERLCLDCRRKVLANYEAKRKGRRSD
jgi:hypothetical protein